MICKNDGIEPVTIEINLARTVEVGLFLKYTIYASQ